MLEKVFFVTPEFVTEKENFDGGLANYLSKIAPALAERGLEVTVIVASNISNDEEIFWNSVRVVRVGVRNNLLRAIEKISFGIIEPGARWLYQSFKLNNRLKTELLSSRANFIVQYSSYCVPSVFAPSKIPFVVRISGYQPQILLENGGKICSFKYIQIKWLEHFMLKRAKFIFGPSNLIADIVNEVTGRPPRVIRTPLKPVDSVVGSCVPEALRGKKYLLFFGSLSILKGIPEIAVILKDLFKTQPEIVFAFAGKSASGIVDSLKKAADIFQDRVVYLGQLNRSELHPVISHAYRVVLPSRFDNLPNTCLEAMGHGRIVIGTRGVTFDEVIEDGKNGFLCEKQNPESLLETILKSLNLSDEESEKMESLARRATEAFSLDQIVNELLKYYSEAINK